MSFFDNTIFVLLRIVTIIGLGLMIFGLLNVIVKVTSTQNNNQSDNCKCECIGGSECIAPSKSTHP